MPQKGSLVYVEGYGEFIYYGGIFVKSNNPEIMLKVKSEESNDEYGKEIITIPLEEFYEKRVYPNE